MMVERGRYDAFFCPGNPFGLDHTLTTGVISGVGREISSGINGRPIQGVIQIDAAINVRVVPNNFGIPHAVQLFGRASCIHCTGAEAVSPLLASELASLTHIAPDMCCFAMRSPATRGGRCWTAPAS